MVWKECIGGVYSVSWNSYFTHFEGIASLW